MPKSDAGSMRGFDNLDGVLLLSAAQMCLAHGGGLGVNDRTLQC